MRNLMCRLSCISCCMQKCLAFFRVIFHREALWGRSNHMVWCRLGSHLYQIKNSMAGGYNQNLLRSSQVYETSKCAGFSPFFDCSRQLSASCGLLLHISHTFTASLIALELQVYTDQSEFDLSSVLLLVFSAWMTDFRWQRFQNPSSADV